ncbi:amidohydrolase [Pseudogemmobacter sonorensis]|uniref:amidohydrolase n=1 Tax=Pseudogemmobacter sonorensis TaxID=2989681 RepID=UPI0036CA1392
MTIPESHLAEARAWRHDFHRHPELGFQETRTSGLIAGLLEGWGLRVQRGIARTGVIGTLGDGSGPRLGIRADIDALPITEETGLPHASVHPGVMHACGHDGHAATLLLAARLAAEAFAQGEGRGTVHFIFQPAEENDGGARVMVEEGLFDRAPCDRIFALHNWPGLAPGQVVAAPGPMMAAFAAWDITLRGRGGHAAMPHLAEGVISAAMALGLALHELPARRIDPLDPAVLTVTQLHAGTAWNVSPESAVLSGTARWFSDRAGDLLEENLRRLARSIAESQGCTAEVDYQRRYPATINTPDAAALVAQAARDAGLSPVPGGPSMASEDFAYMLQDRPGSLGGAYLWLGAARAGENPGLHSPRFDFDDALLGQGAALWLALIRRAGG